MRTVGVDPGLKNFAVVLLDKDGRCEYASMFHDTIQSISQANVHQKDTFRIKIRKLLDILRADELICESFTVRGFGANIIELINLMIGGIQMLCADRLNIPEYGVIPSQWKGDLRRRGFDIDELYEDARKLGVPPHIVDALLMATYLRGDLSFAKFDSDLFSDNVARASKLLAPEDRIKPRRIKKNAVPTRTKPQRRKRMSTPKMLDVEKRRKRKLRSA